MFILDVLHTNSFDIIVNQLFLNRRDFLGFFNEICLRYQHEIPKLCTFLANVLPFTNT